MNTIIDDKNVALIPPCNHAEAEQHAKSLAPHSNIARCYLDNQSRFVTIRNLLSAIPIHDEPNAIGKLLQQIYKLSNNTAQFFSQAPRYEIQQEGPHIDGLRITEIKTDQRIATCWQPQNAELVTRALNALP